MDISSLKYFTPAEEIIDALCAKTNNFNRDFYRILVAYNMSKCAAMMRTTINFPGRGDIPVNFYGVNLAPSGFSKGHSTYIIESKLINGFIKAFLEYTFPELAEKSLKRLAVKRAARKNTNEDDELAKAMADFERQGNILTQFDEGTVPAIKQLRRKLQLATSGSINFDCDEIGANLIKNAEVLTAFLELYDMGNIKEKLVKNTAENQRGEQLVDATPTNMMLFGTPTKLFDSGPTEKMFLEFLDMGYARRSFFGFIEKHSVTPLSVDERIKLINNTTFDNTLEKHSDDFSLLAEEIHFNRNIEMREDVFRKLMEYQYSCELRAVKLPAHAEQRKAEMIHRFFKVAKLMGAYAFYDKTSHIEMHHIDGAIKLAEDCGEAFSRIFVREQGYVRLAKYIASVETPVTHVDISEDCAFYPTSSSAKRNELMNLAITWGHKNSTVIKRSYIDGIELFSGSALETTNLADLKISYGVGVGKGYSNKSINWDKFDELVNCDDVNWVNHQLVSDNRCEKDITPGFNLVVFDVDTGNYPIEMVKLILDEFTYLLHTTKSHTEESPRYRIIMPLSHTLRLDKTEYAGFMVNLFDWFPLIVDTGTKDRSRKWATRKNCKIVRNSGELLDAMAFIPQTKKNDQLKAQAKELGNIDNIERWFITNTGDGNRNNNLYKYGAWLVDSNEDLVEVSAKVKQLNAKISNPLPADELQNTVIRSISRKFQEVK